MGRIIVHIGTHKTGTTSIQRTLARHRAALNEQGLFYPDYNIVGCDGHYAHIGMANALAADHPKFSRQDAENFFRKVQELSPNHSTTLLSAEPLYRQVMGAQSPYHISDQKQYWAARDQYISQFRQLIGPAEIAIVLRRQDEFVESMYQEQVKVTRYTKSFQTYIKESWFHLAYCQQIEAWQRHFEKVHIIPFDKIKGRNITRAFLHEIACDIPDLADAPMQNVSMPHDGVILKRHFNGTPLNISQLNELSEALLSNTFRPAVAPGRRSFFRDKENHEAFVARYSDENASLAQSHGMTLQALFASDVPQGLRYGDALPQDESDRLLAVLKKTLPDLNTGLIKSPAPSFTRARVEAFRKERPASFVQELVANRLDYTAGGPTLVVTFENAGLPHRAAPDRRPWGYKFLTEEGHSVLGVIAKASDWYRSPDLHKALSDLRDAGFFLRFPRVVLVGSSMGGFAATAFASLAPGCHVVSFNPQSTLRRDLVPWETSHQAGIRQDWSGAFSDGPAEIGTAAKVYVLYDPFHEADRKHAERYKGRNVHLVRAPFLGHGLPDAYLEMGLLKDVMRHGIAGTLSEAWYYPAIRKRRTLARYYKGLVAPLAKHGLLGPGQALMRKASELFNDPYFASRAAVFTAADGKLDEAIKALDESARQARKNRGGSAAITRLPADEPPRVDFRPSFSIIVPVFKSWDRLPDLLKGLAAQARQDFELIIADNEPQPFSDERLRQMVPAILAGRWRRVHCPQPGSYAARNAALAEARAPLVVFTDADCKPEPVWLASLAKAARHNPETILAGPVRVHARPVPNLWEIFDTVRGIPQERYISHGYATTANLAIPKAILDRLGGFDAARFSGGDAEFCRRAGRAGVGLHLAQGAIVTHPARTSRVECETKVRRIKGGQLRSGSVRHKALWFLRSFVPPLREMIGYVRNADHPRDWRLKACRVRLWLWAVELTEMARLLVLRRDPERR